jgi:hypothetical protein
MQQNLILLIAGILLGSGIALADQKPENDRGRPCAEGQVPIKIDRISLDSVFSAIPLDSTIAPKKKKLEEPSYEPGGGLLTFWIGVIALFCGFFSPGAILIAGGIFALIGVFLLIYYTKIKKTNPFKLTGRNVLGKIIVGLLFFGLLLALIAGIIMAFVVALALLVAALLSAVINPVAVAAVIMGLGVAWFLVSTIKYLIKYRRYKKSLKNG